jgi:hypothetical protein
LIIAYDVAFFAKKQYRPLKARRIGINSVIRPPAKRGAR